MSLKLRMFLGNAIINPKAVFSVILLVYNILNSFIIQKYMNNFSFHRPHCNLLSKLKNLLSYDAAD